jgi:hypothetical protein
MTARSRLVVVAIVGATWLTLAASAYAGAIALPSLEAGDVEAVPVPLAVAVDPIDGEHLFVIPDRPPPRLVVFHINKNGSLDPEPPLPLPEGLIPTGLWWDFDGYLHIITREGRTFLYCPDCDQVEETAPLPAGADFPSDAAAGYETNVLGDYGAGATGSLWYGTDFGSELPLNGDRPGAIDHMPYGKLKGSHQLGGFVSFGELTDTLLVFDDGIPPSQIDTYPGPPGVAQMAGLAVSQANLTPDSGKATYSLFVSSPTSGSLNSGNVYGAPIQWMTGAQAAWEPISATPLGTPASLDASCESLAVADYGNDTVSEFTIELPPKAECDNIVDLTFGVESASRLKLRSKLKAYAGMIGRGTISFSPPPPPPPDRRSKAAPSASAKLELKAGRVSKATFTFSAAETAAIEGAIGTGGKLTGKATLKLHDKGGHKVTIRQPLTLKASRHGRPAALKVG